VRIRARAPGKVVVLGEYAVLAGAPALVLAIDRPVRVELEPSRDPQCHVATWAPQHEQRAFVPPAPSGTALVDLVLARDSAAAAVPPWSAVLDSRALFAGGHKLGIGSSAAALCAWTAAHECYRQRYGWPGPPSGLEALVALHRAFQSGRGSGLDVAASLTGGLIRYELGPGAAPRVSSVELPIGVGFAGIFAGNSASTADFVGRFEAWRRTKARSAARQIERLGTLASEGLVAAQASRLSGLLDAVAEYGRQLEGLGKAIGIEIVTPEHREIARAARQHGVTYKVSGAGGGDLGLALAADPAAMEAFQSAVVAKGYRVVDLIPDQQGLVVEEHAG
jgi:phosphomevalonate kinase